MSELIDVIERIEATARQLYNKSTANDPVMHCNRFPAWDELDDATRSHWIRTATVAIRGEA
jgi:hypothetical protein